MSFVTRSFISSFRNTTHQAEISLNRVTAKKTLLVCPMPCEERCAQIRNATFDTWERQDINTTAEMAYRYLQNRQGKRNTTIEAVAWNLLPPFGVLHTFPNVGNRGRYKKTANFAKNYLIGKLDRERFDQIKALPFNQQGILDLIKLMEGWGISTESIVPKANKEFFKVSFWGLGA